MYLNGNATVAVIAGDAIGDTGDVLTHRVLTALLGRDRADPVHTDTITATITMTITATGPRGL